MPFILIHKTTKTKLNLIKPHKTSKCVCFAKIIAKANFLFSKVLHNYIYVVFVCVCNIKVKSEVSKRERWRDESYALY